MTIKKKIVKISDTEKNKLRIEKNSIAKKLINWYNKNKRDLPWRKYRDPYKIWLSEIILQQTRVDQGMPYFIRFVDKYPTIYHLARASIDDVLRSWQGLGYYSRARNLYKCANTIVDKYKGKFPSTRNELIKLPGIGPYTSAAIASFAFCKKEAVVDGNVIRVIARLFGIENDIADQKTITQIRIIVDELIPSSNPDLFNQSIMEFGAIYCKPKGPSCDMCIFLGICEAQLKGKQNYIPFKSRKTKKRIRFFNYLLIEIDGKYLLRKRQGSDIWNGLFELFLIETSLELSFDHLQLPHAMARYPQMWEICSESKIYKHALTHQTILSQFYKINMLKTFVFKSIDWKGYMLYSKEEIERLPKSILIDKYLAGEIN